MRSFAQPGLSLLAIAVLASTALAASSSSSSASARVPTAASARAPTAASAGAAAPSVVAGYAELARFFNTSSGCWGGDCTQYLWTSANEMHSTANYLAVSGDAALALPILEAVFAALTRQQCDCWRDDQLWVTLAYARTYEVTRNATYLAAAQGLFGDIVGPWAAWNSSCGGVMWEKGVPYRNAITNELFLTAAMRLHNLTAGLAAANGGAAVAARARSHALARAGGLSYLAWAEKEWAWLNSTALLDAARGVYNDGLSMSNCSLAALNPSGAFWTYNSGVLLDGLVLLGDATGRPELAALAAQVMRAAAAYFSAPGDPAQVLRELSCGRPAGTCGGKDGQQFKGAFVRHLGYAAALMQPSRPADAAWARAYLANQVASIVVNNAAPTVPGATAFGLVWQGPFAQDTREPWVAQGAALDALLAQAMLGD